MTTIDIEYNHITREQLIQFQRDARDRGDDIGVEVAAEAIRLMGLARMWKQRARSAEAALERADGVHRDFLRDLAALPCLQSANGCYEAKEVLGRTTEEEQ